MEQQGLTTYIGSVLGVKSVLMPENTRPGPEDLSSEPYCYSPQSDLILFVPKSRTPEESELLAKIIQATQLENYEQIEVSSNQSVRWVEGPRYAIVFGEFIGGCLGLNSQVGDIQDQSSLKLLLTHSIESMAMTANEKSKKMLKAETWGHIKTLLKS